MNTFNRFIKDESGATAIEYGLIAALIAVAMIAGASSLGKSVSDKMDDVGATMDGVSDARPADAPGAGGD